MENLFESAQRTGGLVVVLQNGNVVVWMGMAQLFHGRYDPQEFPRVLKTANPLAKKASITFMREVLAHIEKSGRFGSGAELGQAFPDGSVHRLKFQAESYYCNGTISPAQILIA